MTGTLIWITGLPGVGKSTLARSVAGALRARGEPVVVLDGDHLRRVLGHEGGYERDQRLRLGLTYARIAAWLAAEGIVVVAAVVALFGAVHAANRAAGTRYLEVLLRAPESLRLTRAGDRDDTMNPRIGVEIEPEWPLSPDLTLDNDDRQQTMDELCAAVLALYAARHAV